MRPSDFVPLRSGLLVSSMFGGYKYARGFTSKSRSFASASSQGMTGSSPITSNAAMTVSAWVKATTIAADMMAFGHSYGSGAQTWRGVFISSTNANKVLAWEMSAASGVSAHADSAIAATAGVWMHVVAVFAAANDRRVYLNGGNKGTNATALTWDGVNMNNNAGYNARNAATSFWNGQIAECAMWSIALTDADVLALNTQIEINGVVGYPPASCVEATSLVAYYPLFGVSGATPPIEPDYGGNAHQLSGVNTPTTATDRPPVIYPPGIAWPSAA